MTKGSSYDLVIVGSGLVGASLACALAGGSLKVAVVEAMVPGIASNPVIKCR